MVPPPPSRAPTWTGGAALPRTPAAPVELSTPQRHTRRIGCRNFRGVSRFRHAWGASLLVPERVAPRVAEREEAVFMHIAQVAPLTEAVPPKLYGGTERVVHWLTEELVALGHDVTLFASGDSRTSGTLEPMWPKALRLDGSIRDPNALHMMMLERVRQRAAEFDFLHFHLDYYLFSRQPTPFVTTLHGRLDLPEHQPVFTTFASIPVISISNAQRRPVPQARWVRTVHHGLPENLLSPRPVKPSYLAFLGRIAPEKRVDRAIRIAARCEIPLKIAAKVDRVDIDYFETEIRPLLSLPFIEYIGEISDREKAEFLSGAIGLIMPINWPEPFGAVNRLSQLSREGVRKRFEERFTARRMAIDYLAVYRSLMEEAAPRPKLVAVQGLH